MNGLLEEYEGINLKFGLPEYYENEDKMNSLFTRQAELQDKLDASDAWNIDNRLDRAMDALRCPPENQPISELSGGERRRVALCRLLLQEPMFYSWMSQLTIWMQSQSIGLNSICNNIRVQ